MALRQPPRAHWQQQARDQRSASVPDHGEDDPPSHPRPHPHLHRDLVATSTAGSGLSSTSTNNHVATRSRSSNLAQCGARVWRAFVNITATVLITLIAVLGFLVLLPLVAKVGTAWFNFNVVWGFFLLANVLFNYYRAAMANGTACLSKLSSSQSAGVPLCKKCNSPKPERAHHCSICNTCCLKMDHHCVWLGNCVGRNNYRYFLLFLLWMSIATGYIGTVIQPIAFGPQSPFYGTLQKLKPKKIEKVRIGRSRLNHPTPSPSIIPSIDPSLSKQALIMTDLDQIPFLTWLSSLTSTPPEKYVFTGVLGIFLICCLACGYTLFLLVFHSYLISNGMTTIEYYQSISVRDRIFEEGKYYRHPYDRGITANVQAIFGNDLPWYLAILPSSRLPPDDTAGRENP